MYLYDLCQLCLLLNKITCTNIIDYYMYLLIRCGENNHNNKHHFNVLKFSNNINSETFP